MEGSSKSKEKVYLKMKRVSHCYNKEKLFAQDVAEIFGTGPSSRKITLTEVLDLTHIHKTQIIISVFDILEKIKGILGESEIDIDIVSSNECLVYIGKPPAQQKKWYMLLKVAAVAIVLFIGSALTVINFHEDVGMHKVHSKIYKYITGREFKNPFIIQIPYSLGIGIGMIVFFNHFSNGKIDKNQPSPLEIEVFTYEKEKDECLIDIYKNQSEEAKESNDERS